MLKLNFQPSNKSNGLSLNDLHTIIHEVRNPVSNISFSCERLIEEIKDIPELHEKLEVYLDIIRRNNNRINQLVTNILYKVEEKEIPEKTINDLIEESLQLCADKIRISMAIVEKNCQQVTAFVDQEAEKLKLAFINIINNAIESMPEGEGILQITTNCEKDELSITFLDNGIGIASHDIENIFKPYYTRKSKGIGIGLAVTKEIIEEINGRIEVNSQPGKGTRFKVIFPVIEVQKE